MANWNSICVGRVLCVAPVPGSNGGLLVLMAVFRVIKAYLSPGFPLDDDHRSGHAGAGGARSRVMRARICPNIRPDTATSAIWNVT